MSYAAAYSNTDAYTSLGITVTVGCGLAMAGYNYVKRSEPHNTSYIIVGLVIYILGAVFMSAGGPANLAVWTALVIGGVGLYKYRLPIIAKIEWTLAEINTLRGKYEESEAEKRGR